MEHKPGWKTSEFWVSVLSVVLPVAAMYLQNAPQDAPYVMIGSSLVAVGYQWTRTHQKNTAVNAAATTAVAQAQAAIAQATKPIQGASNPVGDWLQERNIGAPTSKQALEGLAATAITQLLPQVLDDNDSTGPQDDEVKP